MLDLVLITQTDESLDYDELRERLRVEGGPEPVVVTGGPGQWRSLQDWAVFTCRSRHKLDKKLVLELEDFTVVAKLLLQNSSRKLTGDSEYLQSDLLQVKHCIKKWRQSGKAPVDLDHVIGEAVTSYPGFLTRCGLVDRWEVMRLCLSLQAEAGAGQTVLAVGLSEDERDLLEMVGEVRPAVLSQGDLQVKEKVPVAQLDLAACSACVPASTELLDESLSILSSYLRLMVCSKDEISLARAVTGPGLLTCGQFTSVRREAEEGHLPMYQTITSFVRKVELGGRSYQPEENNKLHQLLPSLTQFSNIMEKLQTRLEETSGAVSALTAVLTLLKSWLTKQGYLTDLAVLDTMQRLLQEVHTRQSSLEATPAKGRMGRPAMRLLTGLVDIVGCLRLESSDGLSGTPARQSRLVQTFRTPQPDTVLDPEDEVDRLVEEKSLSERLAGEEVSKTPVSRPSYPRFRSCNNFTEGSPAVLRSEDRGVRTGGTTLRARAHQLDTSPAAQAGLERTKEILQEVRDRERLEREEQVENVKNNIKKTKRCLSKEVDEIVREKMGMKRKAEVDKSSPVRDKKPKKKKFSTPKGQRKLTSFFTR